MRTHTVLFVCVIYLAVIFIEQLNYIDDGTFFCCCVGFVRLRTKLSSHLQLANRGLDIVLISRSIKKLREVAEKIGKLLTFDILTAGPLHNDIIRMS